MCVATEHFALTNKNKEFINSIKDKIEIDLFEEIVVNAKNKNKTFRYVTSTINKVIEKPLLQTRNQSNQSKNIIKKINFMFKEKDYNKLNYLYYECFGKTENDINQVFSKILEEVSKYNDNYDKINDFLKIISQK